MIDTHIHLYSDDERKYPKKEDPLRPPAGKGTLEHLKQETAAVGVTGAVLVQTGSAYSYDNRLVADTVSRNSDWLAAVVTLDPRDPASVQQLRRLAGIPGVRGWRMPCKSPLDTEVTRKMWQTCRELGLVVCPLLGWQLADELHDLLLDFADVLTAIDHCMYLNVREAPDYPTLRKLARLAALPNTYAKLTMTVSGSEEGYPCRDMHPLVRQAVDMFGAHRCMTGFGFPTEVWQEKMSYADHARIFTEELPLTQEERQQILRKAPARLWFGESE